MICLCTIVTLFFLLDFIIKNYTTYGIAKEIPGPYMWPIIGAINFFFSPQGQFFNFFTWKMKIYFGFI